MTEQDLLYQAEKVQASVPDSEPLLSRFRRRQQKQRQELLLIIAVVTVLLGGLLWHSLIYSRTPDYAMKQILESLESRDSETFDRYVKLDAIMLVAFDDLTTTLFNYDEALTPETHRSFLDFYQRIKPQLAHGTAETIRRYVASGEWTLPSGQDLLKGRQLGIDYDRFLERSQLRNTEFVALDSVTVNVDKTDEAVAKVKIRDKYTGVDFALQVLWSGRATGTGASSLWKITGIISLS